MAQFRNDAPGARAVLLQDRSYLLMDPGETLEICDAAVLSAAAGITRVDAGQAPARDRRAILEAMNDAELRGFVEKVTGKRPHPNAKRATMIERALADG